MKKILAGLVGLLFGATATVAGAAPFSSMRIGDVDGFGYTPTGLVRATGPPHTTPADTNGNGLLEAGEFLPDLNANGNVYTGGGDDFDNRSASEIANTLQSCVGCVINPGTSGSNWTDIALSTSFTTATSFPDPDGAGIPNEAVFNFRFWVAGGDIASGSGIFLNVVFGDYDVSPANVLVTRANSSTFTIPLVLQGGGEDGLIQAATATLSFFDVFTTLGFDEEGYDLGWDGNLTVKFVNPNEPYLAFDYAELSLIPLVSVPEPGDLLLWAVGLAGLLLGRMRRKA